MYSVYQTRQAKTQWNVKYIRIYSWFFKLQQGWCVHYKVAEFLRGLFLVRLISHNANIATHIWMASVFRQEQWKLQNNLEYVMLNQLIHFLETVKGYRKNANHKHSYILQCRDSTETSTLQPCLRYIIVFTSWNKMLLTRFNIFSIKTRQMINDDSKFTQNLFTFNNQNTESKMPCFVLHHSNLH